MQKISAAEARYLVQSSLLIWILMITFEFDAENFRRKMKFNILFFHMVLNSEIGKILDLDL